MDEHAEEKHGQERQAGEPVCSKFYFVFQNPHISKKGAEKIIQKLFMCYVKDGANLFVDEDIYKGNRRFIFTWKSEGLHTTGGIRIQYMGRKRTFKEFSVRWVVEADTGRVFAFFQSGEGKRDNRNSWLTWEGMYRLVF